MEDSKLTTPDLTIYNWRIETQRTLDDNFQQNFDSNEHDALRLYNRFVAEKKYTYVKLYKRGYTPWEQIK